jgi:hypothetical protein
MWHSRRSSKQILLRPPAAVQVACVMALPRMLHARSTEAYAVCVLQCGITVLSSTMQCPAW